MTEPRLVLLLDLDQTLFLYETPLEKSQTLLAERLAKGDPARMLSIIEFLRRNPEPFALAGLPDAAHVWCSPELAALMTVMDRWVSRRPPGELDLLGQELFKIRGPRRIRALPYRIKAAIRRSEPWRAVVDYARLRLPALASREERVIQEACDVFEASATEEIVPAGGVRELLEEIRGEWLPLICTEGRVEWQSYKLRRLGLEELIPQALISEHTLGAAPVVAELERALMDPEGLSLQARHSLLPLHDLLSSYTVKGECFARAVTQSLGSDPDRAAELLGRLEPPPEPPPDETVIVCLVGDSQVRDIAPFRRLLGRKIRLVKIEVDGWPEDCTGCEPDRVFREFSAFLRWFREESDWKRIEPLPQIPRFPSDAREIVMQAFRFAPKDLPVRGYIDRLAAAVD